MFPVQGCFQVWGSGEKREPEDTGTAYAKRRGQSAERRLGPHQGRNSTRVGTSVCYIHSCAPGTRHHTWYILSSQDIFAR